MLGNTSAGNDFWCPVEEKHAASTAGPGPELTPGERAALSRFGCREWVADAQIDRLQALGLVEKVFGQAVLTRLGRALLGRAG